MIQLYNSKKKKLYSFGCPGTYFLYRADLELREIYLPTSASWGPGTSVICYILITTRMAGEEPGFRAVWVVWNWDKQRGNGVQSFWHFLMVSFLPTKTCAELSLLLFFADHPCEGPTAKAQMAAFLQTTWSWLKLWQLHTDSQGIRSRCCLSSTPTLVQSAVSSASRCLLSFWWHRVMLPRTLFCKFV